MSSNESSSGEIKHSNFYDAAPMEPHLIYQGEILSDVPFFNMHRESRWLIVRTKSGRPINEALQNGNLGGTVKVLDSNQTKVNWDQQFNGDFAIGRLSKAPVLVLSQTCDCQNKDFIQIAPIFAAASDPKYINRVKSGDILSAFWIDKHPPEIPEDGFADFELIQSLHKSYRKGPEAKHFRINQDKVLELQRAITRYFGRPNSFDVGADKVPRTGSYLCVQCFYWRAKISKLELVEGDEFRSCNECDGTKWVVHLGSLK